MGLITAVSLVVLGPVVWVAILGNAEPVFPSKYPALYSITVAFVGIWLFSWLDRSRQAQAEAQAFDAQFVRSQTGIGAEGAASH
jgi:cation/acetate symporter